MTTLWPLIVQFLEAYTPLTYSTTVRWFCPGMGVFKCNTDASSKENLNISTTSFYVRNDRGELVAAQANKVDICTAFEA